MYPERFSSVGIVALAGNSRTWSADVGFQKHLQACRVEVLSMIQTPGSPFTDFADKFQPLEGLVETSYFPLLVAAHPILISRREGPARGAVVMAEIASEVLLRWLPIPRSPAAIRPVSEPHRTMIVGASIRGAFDEAVLPDQCFGDIELAVELLNMFEFRGEQSLRDMQAAVRNDDWLADGSVIAGADGNR